MDIHVFETDNGGINPVNNRSEFAGVSLDRQRQKIRDGYSILLSHKVKPFIFFPPAHTFDNNTLRALEMESKIRVISDTVASDIYFMDNFYFIPQQSGKVRKLPFKMVTFCYHPNIMTDQDFTNLERFLFDNSSLFGTFSEEILKKRKKGLMDMTLEKIYFARKKKPYKR